MTVGYRSENPDDRGKETSVTLLDPSGRLLDDACLDGPVKMQQLVGRLEAGSLTPSTGPGGSAVR
jgi:hypothetical protein